MKRHYEIMRIMRTKKLDERDSKEAVDSLLYIYLAILYRKEDVFGVSVSSSSSTCHVNLTKLLKPTFLRRDSIQKSSLRTLLSGL